MQTITEYSLEGYIRPEELLALLGKDRKPLSKRTLARWEQKRNAPPRVKIGRRILYRVDDVKAWLDRNIQGREPSGRKDRRARAK